ncbi:hypothetical protein GGR52DRAFT_546088 [Hypoxylon sp. FL1284]|nr:hypothetical protein GGR52DRAFT_546088 [Hypoxylon sp. FL1284]
MIAARFLDMAFLLWTQVSYRNAVPAPTMTMTMSCSGRAALGERDEGSQTGTFFLFLYQTRKNGLFARLVAQSNSCALTGEDWEGRGERGERSPGKPRNLGQRMVGWESRNSKKET